ncbi:MAG: amidohydrolase family protein [marine benthic group bacterium]|nr:amidohydrolase family protein [Candidatus Benthicola marisminoris]
MSRPVVLGNGHILSGWEDPSVVTGGAVAWEGERILAVGPEVEVLRAHPDALYLDAGGGLIAPGLVNLHHHFYSSLARGLDPGTPMRNFPEILDRLWWRLDRALDPDAVRISALLSALDCVRWGCTTVFDHHASPSCIPGSLDLVAGALDTAGIGGVLCYEVTDRNGDFGAEQGIAENLEFLASRAGDPRIRGVFGLHASFTVSDETLATVAARRPANAGVHVHVAEHPVDVECSMEEFGATPIQRLQRSGLLDERALLAHAIHVNDHDYRLAADAGAVLIHNPESNANNGVGRLDLPRAAGFGCSIGLGTDGMSSSVLRALRSAFLGLRGGSEDPELGFETVPGLLATNTRVAGRFLDEPLLGQLVPGAPADVIAVTSPPPTTIDSTNWFGHLAYGAAEAPVRHTVARGSVVLQDYVPTGLDSEELAAEARSLAPALWRRFHELDWNTPYLGPARAGRKEKTR